MSLSSNVDLRAWSRRLGYLERCAEEAPERTYEDAKAIVALIRDVGDDLGAKLQAAGLCWAGDDRARDFDAALYRYIVVSNPNASVFAVSEGFGEHIDGPAGERIKAAAERDRDFLGGLSHHATAPTADEIIDRL